MRVAFLHYHLRTGGVTSVLQGQVAAARRFGEVLVLTGDRAGTPLPCPVFEIAGLGYDPPGVPSPDPRAVAESVLRVVADTWPGGCDILHVHNPTLAKNRNFLKILKYLQDAGTTLFLQVHDFAEDGRPGAYFREAYPENCHYGVLNTRDERLLSAAGLDAAGVHRLPNAVHPLPAGPGRPALPLVLYPVRAIRRKNLGEAILLSLYLKPPAVLAVTQPPNSRGDWASYRDWTAFARNHHLRFAFEAGRRRPFADLVQAAGSMVTTSIAEGFGFAFLEPWTAGKRVWGRKLTAICRDFEDNGVQLDGLYQRLAVPLDWFAGSALADRWRRAVVAAAAAYGRTVSETAVARGWAALTRGDTLDFGIPGERMQRRVLRRLLERPRERARLMALNPWLSNPGAVRDARRVIAANRRAVEMHYGWDAYGRRLEAVYRRVAGHPVRHRIDRGVLLEGFMDLRRFSLLQWGPYGG